MTAGAGTENPRRRRRASYVRRHGVRHLLVAYDLSTDRLYGHIKTRKDRRRFKEFLRYVRSLHLTRSASLSCSITSAPTSRPTSGLGVRPQRRAGLRPLLASWLNRIEAQFQVLRYFTLDGTDHESHGAQARMIRRYVAWRNRNAQDKALRELVKRANVA